ncbi:hypothetical protein [Clostridium haemolyticum]|uniref:Uncharacterized protein n=1 Tax=Clostridium haemolyticum NCTC 9693 TaxID=1443114 RepID=A0ABR4THZ8_CLOHA|nr:hypothetical protein [Clostridium haemolyticum]KEI18281.1 hypothetical protein Z960_03990 [Clostridium haemolyticum NCTC 9693]KGN04205.1 hypothetical protein Z961_04460 [Clostridium haemolyticum NCTC 8350]
MKIRDLNGKLHIAAKEDLYIKPVYGIEEINGYAICHNLGNNEVEITRYSDPVIAKHMLKLIKLYSNASEQYDVEACCFSEFDIAKDLWIEAGERLKRVTYNAKVGVL